MAKDSDREVQGSGKAAETGKFTPGMVTLNSSNIVNVCEAEKGGEKGDYL